MYKKFLGIYIPSQSEAVQNQMAPYEIYVTRFKIMQYILQ